MRVEARFDPPAVGVRALRSPGEHAGAPPYQGISYCDAVRRAGEGETLRLLPGSIQLCRWAPVVLGLKAPQGRFEQGLAPRLAFPVAGLLLAPLDRFPGEPQVVIVQTSYQVLREALAAVGPRQLWDAHGGRLDRSALPLFTDGQATPRRALIGAVNRALASLARSSRWQALTQRLFRSGLVTAGFDALISRTLADMSVCRNSTVVPLLSSRVNVSFFCTGGITWGRNRADQLTSGWPWPDFQRVHRSHFL
jgi:hypothetical protein